MSSVDLAFVALCSGIPLAGGCESGDEAAPAVATPRELVEAVPDECLVGGTITVHHDGGTYESTEIEQTLQTVAQPGDRIDISFSVAPGCPGAQPRVSLVSYTRDKFYLDIHSSGGEMYDVDVGVVDKGQATLSVQLPPCAFMATLAFGDPIPEQRLPDDTYAAQGRLILASAGGDTSCGDLPELRIKRFDPLGPGWGDAPFVTTFGWQIASGADKLTCSLDLDDDGAMELADIPCPADATDDEIEELTKTVYTEPGKYRPTLVVADGVRRTWARTTVYSNRIDFHPHVRQLEKFPGFIEAETHLEAPPLPSIVKLAYVDQMHVPLVKAGDIALGFGGERGYMLEIETAKRTGAILTLTGHPVDLPAVVAGGFYGVRDHQISMAQAHCASPLCAGAVVTPVAEPPGDAPVVLKPPPPDPELRLGLKVALPVKDGGGDEVGEIEFFGGMLVKAFELDLGFLSVNSADIQMGPLFELAFVGAAPLLDQTLDIGEFILGPLPSPLPLFIVWHPTVDLDAAVKFAIKGSLSIPFRFRNDGSGWDIGADPELTASGEGAVPGSGMEPNLEIKATSIHKFAIEAASIDGPYVAPTIAIVLKEAIDEACNFCLTTTLEGGLQLGWELPWIGDIFEPEQITIAEAEVGKMCKPYTDTCEPPPPPPPPGGSWGDVHLISHDGLLFDFQAGGEFVLVRSTVPGDPFEIQTRQEPGKFGDFTATDLTLSYNTAVATVVDGRRVGLYTRHAEPVSVDGVAMTLAPGATVPLGQGSLALDDDGVQYTITYPTGDVLTARRRGDHGDARAHFNISVVLAPDRAGAVEGMLGDFDGDLADDVSLGDGGHLPLPVSFDTLYHADNNFAGAWRVAAPDSLLDYADGKAPATYLGYPYDIMPTTLPPSALPHSTIALEACAACPASLQDACMTDVGFTGEASFAAACNELPGEPLAEMPARSGPHPVYPRPWSMMDCDRQELVFRAPGAAHAHEDTTPSFRVNLDWWEADVPGLSGWVTVELLDTEDRPAEGWGDKFTCRDLGTDWGECTMKLNPATSPCVVRPFSNTYRWQLRPGGSSEWLFEAQFSGAV